MSAIFFFLLISMGHYQILHCQRNLIGNKLVVMMYNANKYLDTAYVTLPVGHGIIAVPVRLL